LNGTGYVSSTVKRLRKRLSENPDKKEAFKDSLKSTVAFGIEDFDRRLRSGEVKIDNVNDFEKLAKLGLLLYGEATERVEETTDIESITVEEYESIKNLEEFEAIKRQLSLNMNKRNEEA